ncbi:leucine-rich repeat-containing protein 74A isoform X2 [Monodelphis domestica]|uniref:leucine-rich repeat-containing protein 74A isoform X2 n=1 Tax=Monodelphis domestica TaxID=13616 RepID=UPI0024E26F89|nr:leucine-rich repeat-containing protein 74A isoform X2 [Monodelphis domestica]
MDYDDDDIDELLELKQDETEQANEESDSNEEEIICEVDSSPIDEKNKNKIENYETDLELEDPEKFFTTGQEELYREACKLIGVIPVSYFIRNMEETYMNLNHHGLGPKGTKAIAVALVSNTTITRLELEDNWILEDGALSLMQMLHENYYIQELNVSGNHLDSKGAKIITDFLTENTSSLWSIQLAGNDFKDDTAPMFCNALTANYRIKVLDLSHNFFSEKGGEQLGQMLAFNEGLQTLDLSWNQLHLKGAVALSNSLRMSQNPVTMDGVLAMVMSVKRNPKSRLEEMDVSNVLVTEGFVKQLEGVFVVHPELDVLYGEVVGTISKTVSLPVAFNVIKAYVEKNKTNMLEFFKSINHLGTSKMPVAEFRKALTIQNKVHLNRPQIRELVKKLDPYETGIIDYSTLEDMHKPGPPKQST